MGDGTSVSYTHLDVYKRQFCGRMPDVPRPIQYGRMVYCRPVSYTHLDVYKRQSTDLVNWEPMLDENGEFLKVMTPRAGKFDSDLTECGPPAILTDMSRLFTDRIPQRPDCARRGAFRKPLLS